MNRSEKEIHLSDILTMAGLSAARARGRMGGRPRKLKNGKVAMAQRLRADHSHTIDEICHFYVREADIEELIRVLFPLLARELKQKDPDAW